MRALDFKYDNHWLSEYGFTICTFGDEGGFSSVSSGATLEFQTVSQQNGRFLGVAGAKYSGAISITFSICKEFDDVSDPYVQQDEIRNIYRWLNRTEFCEFIPTPMDEYSNDVITYYGSFNVTSIEHCGKTVGFELTFYSNRPFGLGQEIEEVREVAANEEFLFNVNSDEVGILYPQLFEITLEEGGNFTLTNETENRITLINNCSAGEVVTLDCFNQIATSTASSHKLYNDFNFNFPRFKTSFEDSINVFTASLSCTCRVVYRPVRKAVI
jgi:hypothetical protein